MHLAHHNQVRVHPEQLIHLGPHHRERQHQLLQATPADLVHIRPEVQHRLRLARQLHILLTRRLMRLALLILLWGLSLNKRSRWQHLRAHKDRQLQIKWAS